MSTKKTAAEWRLLVEEVFALDVPSPTSLREEIADRLETDAEFDVLQGIKDRVLHVMARDFLLEASRNGMPRDEAIGELIRGVVRQVQRLAHQN